MAESAERCEARCERRNEFTLADGWYLRVIDKENEGRKQTDQSLFFFFCPFEMVVAHKSPGGMSAAVGSARASSPQSRLLRLSGADVTADFPVKEPERMGHLYRRNFSLSDPSRKMYKNKTKRIDFHRWRKSIDSSPFSLSYSFSFFSPLPFLIIDFIVEFTASPILAKQSSISGMPRIA